jgi:hypothetical protein
MQVLKVFPIIHVISPGLNAVGRSLGMECVNAWSDFSKTFTKT